MKFKKVLGLVLCFALVFSCLIIPASSSSKSSSAVPASAEPVTPSENDFEYKLLPENAPVRASLTGYKGTAERIVIPETLGGYPVQIIASTAFKGNEDITYVKLPSTVTMVAANAFNQCSSLTAIEIGESSRFATVDGVLYAKDTASGSATYGENTKIIAFPAGRGGSFTIPYGVKTIGSYAFDHCYNLTELKMYNTVTRIESYGISFCWNLENLKLSDNLRYLGTKSLYACDSLSEIYLPATITEIGADAVLGNIDSDNHKVYYFVDGIHCTPDTYAYYYLVKQGLPENIIIKDYRSITDIDTGVKFIDAYSVLPLDTDFDLSVKTVDIDEVSDSLPTRYSSAFAYDISVVSGSEEYSPDGKFILEFTGVPENSVPSATKIYKFYGSRLVNVNGSPNTTVIGTQVGSGGRFVVLVNDDFSLKCDVDGDGQITLYDARAALYAATETMVLTDEQFAAADTDNSGKITIDDVLTIMKKAAGIK